jgi:hypothetical protein
LDDTNEHCHNNNNGIGHCHNNNGHNTSNSSNFLIIMRSFDASAYANGNFLINLMRQRKGNFVINLMRQRKGNFVIKMSE